jgi:hypothetical protein
MAPSGLIGKTEMLPLIKLKTYRFVPSKFTSTWHGSVPPVGCLLIYASSSLAFDALNALTGHESYPWNSFNSFSAYKQLLCLFNTRYEGLIMSVKVLSKFSMASIKVKFQQINAFTFAV